MNLKLFSACFSHCVKHCNCSVAFIKKLAIIGRITGRVESRGIFCRFLFLEPAMQYGVVMMRAVIIVTLHHSTWSFVCHSGCC